MNRYIRSASRTVILPLTILILLPLAALPLPAGEAIVVAEVANILAADGTPFSKSASLDGNRAAIGDVFSSTGLVHVFEQEEDGNWVPVAKVFRSGGPDFDHFGEAVSLDGDRIVAGARWAQGNAGDVGAVYVFERDSAGHWAEVAKILAPDGDAGDEFGASVSLDGDRIAIGAKEDNDNGLDSGSAYIFERDPGGNWLQRAKILAADGDSPDAFGVSVSLDGERVIVGANRNADNGPSTGSAYVFERDVDGNWSQVVKLLAPDADRNARFGTSVSLEGDRAVIGADGDQDNGFESGAAYVLERKADGQWTPVAKLLPADGWSFSNFGQWTSLDGDSVAISSPFDNDNGANSGSAYLFERNIDGTWSQTAKILPLDGTEDDTFGDSISMNGGRVLATARNSPGYVFEKVLVSPQLSISGTCPGEITITSGGNTPRDRVELYQSANAGTFALAGGRCEGTQLGLDAPELIRDGTTDFTPDFTLSRSVDEFWCGRYLQMIDMKTCLTSEVVQVP